MTEVTRFLGTDLMGSGIDYSSAVSLIDRATFVVPTVVYRLG